MLLLMDVVFTTLFHKDRIFSSRPVINPSRVALPDVTRLAT